MRKEEERVEGLKRALKIAASSSLDTDPKDINQSDFDRTEQIFRNETHLLQEACQQHEDELRHLDSLLKEQAMISRDLDQLEYATEEEQNALELEARAFDNDQEQLYHRLAEIQAEAEQLHQRTFNCPQC
jgi:K+/H+ antiporter YhaU regulatory subunit KhtT